MKCVKHTISGTIERVSDGEAARLTKDQNYKYCPKKEWRKQKAAGLEATTKGATDASPKADTPPDPKITREERNQRRNEDRSATKGGTCS